MPLLGMLQGYTLNENSRRGYREKTKQAALAKNSAARMTYMTSTKTCIGTPTTAVENLLPREGKGLVFDMNRQHTKRADHKSSSHA